MKKTYEEADRSATTLKMLYVNPFERIVETRQVEPSLDAYYKLLDCEYIDIVRRSIRGKYYDIICDDSALLKDFPRISMINMHHQPMLFGSLLVCLDDGEGEMVGITDQDVKRIKSDIVILIDPDGTTPVLRGDY